MESKQRDAQGIDPLLAVEGVEEVKEKDFGRRSSAPRVRRQ